MQLEYESALNGKGFSQNNLATNLEAETCVGGGTRPSLLHRLTHGQGSFIFNDFQAALAYALTVVWHHYRSV